MPILLLHDHFVLFQKIMYQHDSNYSSTHIISMVSKLFLSVNYTFHSIYSNTNPLMKWLFKSMVANLQCNYLSQYCNLIKHHMRLVWHATCFLYCPAGYFCHDCPFHFAPWVAQHGKIRCVKQPTLSSILPSTLAGLMQCLGTLCYCDGVTTVNSMPN